MVVVVDVVVVVVGRVVVVVDVVVVVVDVVVVGRTVVDVVLVDVVVVLVVVGVVMLTEQPVVVVTAINVEFVSRRLRTTSAMLAVVAEFATTLNVTSVTLTVPVGEVSELFCVPETSVRQHVAWGMPAFVHSVCGMASQIVLAVGVPENSDVLPPCTPSG